MLGFTVHRPKKGPVVSGPRLLPRKKAVARQVFLSTEKWERLSRTAEFHEAVFEAMGASQSMSRNDLVDGFLEWALEEYWSDKGGFPVTKKDWEEKVQRHAEALKKAQTNK